MGIRIDNNYKIKGIDMSITRELATPLLCPEISIQIDNPLPAELLLKSLKKCRHILKRTYFINRLLSHISKWFRLIIMLIAGLFVSSLELRRIILDEIDQYKLMETYRNDRINGTIICEDIYSIRNEKQSMSNTCKRFPDNLLPDCAALIRDICRYEKDFLIYLVIVFIGLSSAAYCISRMKEKHFFTLPETDVQFVNAKLCKDKDRHFIQSTLAEVGLSSSTKSIRTLLSELDTKQNKIADSCARILLSRICEVKVPTAIERHILEYAGLNLHREKRLGFLMGLHRRLGAHSSIQSLTYSPRSTQKKLIRNIFEYAEISDEQFELNKPHRL